MSNQRNDANESLFFARDLELQESRVYAKEYPAIKFRQIFPMNSEGGPGLQWISYKMLDQSGVAQVLATGADDPPVVNLSAQEFTARVFAVADAVSFTQQDLDAALYAGTNLDGAMLDAARLAYERKLEMIADQGDAATGLLGYNNNPNIPIVAPTTSAGAGDDTWPNKTADEILADFSLLYRTIITNSKEVHVPNTAILSSNRMALLKQLRLSNTSTFLFDALRQAYPDVRLVEWSRMARASVAGAERMSMLVADPMVLEFKEPAPFTIFPLRRTGAFRYAYECKGHTAGVVVRYPLACAHMDGI